jgi:antitoxin (DNA-binding transcriptional repressor) of toxin-antitoxin stability system
MKYGIMAESISKSKLKARMLEIFRQLEASGDDLIVTDHGRPVLRIVPYNQKASVDDLFASLQGHVIYLEDVDAPTAVEWNDL